MFMVFKSQFYCGNARFHTVFDSNNDIGTTPATPEDYYSGIYFEALDTVVNCIKDMFDQEGYKIYSKLELLPLKFGKKDQIMMTMMIYFSCIKVI